ncbi:MAG: Mfa1 family fimbria major subunit [Muribaculaceae bacterium]|nr:Mfa1 family fimbria major subunit [Muribaculaceae bacterium]
MKKIYGFAALCAAMTLASCSNNDEPNVVPGNVNDGTPGYLAVNIVNDDVTRADSGTDNGQFDFGIPDENAVSQATFVLFNGKTRGQIINLEPTEWTDNNSATNSVASTSAKVIVINRSATEPEITDMLTILNAPGPLKTSLAGCADLDAVMALIEDYTGENYTKSGAFVMSTAAYDKDGTKVYLNSLTGKVAQSVNAALANPVDVYVDRNVAKVSVTGSLEGDANKGAEVSFGDATTKTPVKIAIQSISIANKGAKTSVVKNLGTYTNSEWTKWTDPDNYRSYWAITPLNAEVADDYVANLTWNAYAASTFTDVSTAYINENTNQDKLTSVMVTAQLQDKDGAPLDLVVLLRGKKYYKSADGIEAIVNTFTSTYAYKDGNVYKSLKPEQFIWVKSDKGPEYAHIALDPDLNLTLAQVNTDGRWADMTTEQKTAFNTLLASDECTALKWTNGACYYFVEIKNPSASLPGVVRNHVYNINLTDIQGLGVPVFDPAEWPIDPKNPDPEFDDDIYYTLGAQINVLKWAKVSQDAHFNNGQGKY